MLHVVVRSQGIEQVIDHQDGPLEFGRGVARDVPRCFMTDPYVSRNHARIELQPTGGLLVENLSQMSPIGLDDGGLIATGELRTVPLPQRLRMGESEVEISAAGGAPAAAPADLGKTVIASRPPEMAAAADSQVAAAATQPGSGWNARDADGGGRTVIAAPPPLKDAAEPPAASSSGSGTPAGPGSTVIAAFPHGGTSQQQEPPASAAPAEPTAASSGGWGTPAGPGSTVIAAFPHAGASQQQEPAASAAPSPPREPQRADGLGRTVIAAMPPDISGREEPQPAATDTWSYTPTATVIASAPPPAPEPPAEAEPSWDPEPVAQAAPAEEAGEVAETAPVGLDEPISGAAGLVAEEAPPPETQAEETHSAPLEWICQVAVAAEPSLSSLLGAAPGTRQLLGLTSGSFKGTRFEGKTAERGSSILVTVARKGELRLDFRLSLATGAEGTFLLLGEAVVTGDEHGASIRGAFWLENVADASAWPGRSPAIGIGHADAGTFSLDIYVLNGG